MLREESHVSVRPVTAVWGEWILGKRHIQAADVRVRRVDRVRMRVVVSMALFCQVAEKGTALMSYYCENNLAIISADSEGIRLRI